jgi:hypothetical protein
VRGFLSRSSDNALKYTVDIGQDIIVPKAQHDVAERSQFGGAPRICIARHRMLSAVHLNDQPRRLTAKIHDIALQRHLTAKLQPIQPSIAQAKPKLPLGIGLIPP